MLEFDRGNNQTQIEDEMQAFFDIILGNLEQQISAYNNV
jgi:hypothetical protein